MTLEEKVKQRIDACIEFKDDTEALIDIVCPFFKEGGFHVCPTCMQGDDEVETCRGNYLTFIYERPQEVYDSGFMLPIVKKRECGLIAVNEAHGIGVACDRCYMSMKCPKYQKGYECAYDWGANAPRSTQDFFEFIIQTQYERVKRASVFEAIDGGVPDTILSGEMDRLQKYIEGRANSNVNRLSINVEATSSAGAPETGGILAKLFGGGSSEKKELPAESPASKIPAELIDAKEVEYEEIKADEKPKKSSRRISGVATSE